MVISRLWIHPEAPLRLARIISRENLGIRAHVAIVSSLMLADKLGRHADE